MQQNWNRLIITIGVALLSLLPTAVAHGHHENMNTNMEGGSQPVPALSLPTLLEVVEPHGSYFQHGEHSGLMVAHIVLMTLGWVFILPIGGLSSNPQMSKVLLIIQALCFLLPDLVIHSWCSFSSWRSTLLQSY